ncbi:ABC transporter substrate-binding protein [Ruegeria sp. EL01]|uniref:ABC transporter substrate-binding protein n=1 Tax=Ruegeria sp. EL01 TaxID=2107578 RepID=UPI000EA82155|nr:extracellular solute-binding protein [Ruegeria sp. EL01]
MKQTMKTSLYAGALVLLGSVAHAGCGVTSGNVNILGNDFPALQAVADEAIACAHDGMKVEANLTTEHREIMSPALTANPAEYNAVFIANSQLMPLLAKGLIRPLDDLVAKHGQNLAPNQLIRVDGKIVSVAFMANAQHLFYRKDILDQVGARPPESYEDVLAVAEKIRAAGKMEHPVALNTKVGWNLAEEFINMYLGHDTPMFKAGTAEPAINNDAGVSTLNTLKALTGYSNPDYLTFDSNTTQALWESGDLALATMWGSRGTAILDDEGSNAAVVSSTIQSGAPTVAGGSKPATSLWWNGFSIATNTSDEDAEAAFVAMVNGISTDMVKANNDKAAWLIEGYEPNVATAGIVASMEAGASPYPMLPYMGVMHTALGGELVDFLQGNESAKQTLSDIEAAYTTAAREKGFLE